MSGQTAPRPGVATVRPGLGGGPGHELGWER
jgi:hypothetical protein